MYASMMQRMPQSIIFNVIRR